MAFNGPVEDKLAIHELVMVYGDAVTRKDSDDWGSTWDEKAKNTEKTGIASLLKCNIMFPPQVYL